MTTVLVKHGKIEDDLLKHLQWLASKARADLQQLSNLEPRDRFAKREFRPETFIKIAPIVESIETAFENKKDDERKQGKTRARMPDTIARIFNPYEFSC